LLLIQIVPSGNQNLDIFAGGSGKINFFKDSKGTQSKNYILIDNTGANANLTSALVFANTDNTTVGAIKVNSTGTGASLLSTMQITNINSLNIGGLQTLGTTQVGTPLVLDPDNNIVKGPGKTYYALYVTGEPNTANTALNGLIKVFIQSSGEQSVTNSGSKSYYLFNHLMPMASSTFTPTWVGGAGTLTTRNSTVSKPYLKFPCRGYWFISFSTLTNTPSSMYFQIITIFKNMKIGDTQSGADGTSFFRY
jgi:hypothetical protein